MTEYMCVYSIDTVYTHLYTAQGLFEVKLEVCTMEACRPAHRRDGRPIGPSMAANAPAGRGSEAPASGFRARAAQNAKSSRRGRGAAVSSR